MNLQGIMSLIGGRQAWRRMSACQYVSHFMLGKRAIIKVRSTNRFQEAQLYSIRAFWQQWKKFQLASKWSLKWILWASRSCLIISDISKRLFQIIYEKWRALRFAERRKYFTCTPILNMLSRDFWQKHVDMVIVRIVQRSDKTGPKLFSD